MKLTKFLLTGMAALALGACSSSDNTPVNGDKTATLGFSINFPSSTSRAVDPTGETFEQSVNQIDVRVKIGSYSDETFHFTKADFTQSGSNSNLYTLNDASKMQVYPGSGTVYVTVNSAEGNTTTAAIITPASYSSLDALAASGGIADTGSTFTIGSSTYTGHFLMTGSSAVTTEANKTTTANVQVNRVAAKIEELSLVTPPASDITYTTNLEGTQTTLNKDKTISVQLVSYSFLNLNKTTNLYPTASTYTPATASADTYLQYNAQAQDGYAFPATTGLNKSITKATSGDTNNGITYCLENVSTTLPTYIVYKAKIKYDGTAIANDANCYVLKQGDGKYTFYKDFATMNTANNNIYGGLGLSETSTEAQFLAQGIVKYVGGFCYYVKAINQQGLTAKSGSILRNNWYRLTVSAINGLGGYDVDPKNPSAPTLLSLTVTVMPWTVIDQTVSF